MAQRYRKRRRRFRRSPLSDLLTILAVLILLAGLVFILYRMLSPTPGDPEADPSPSASQSQEPSPSPSPSMTVEELPWNLKLVNSNHPLSSDFTITTSTLSNGLTFDSRAYGALMDMLDACRAAGLEPLVCSAYRSVEKQTELFEQKVDSLMEQGLSYDEAYAAAATEVAIPGTSEHSLGLAADICALSYQILDESQEDTPEQQWLMEHCWEYGFILRYPPEKQSVTGIIYEPWHYRYVGVEDALKIRDSGLCLEEYLEQEYGIT